MHNAQSPTAVTANLLWLSKKRSNYPELTAFGLILAGLRGRKRSREQISKALETLKVPLGGSTLAQYEKGKVWAPDAGVLWGLAEIYNVPLDYLARLLARNRQDATLDVDLLRHEVPVQRTLTGEADETASDRARRLEARLHEYDGLVPELNRVTTALVRVAAKRAEDAATTAAQTSGRRRHRSTD